MRHVRVWVVAGIVGLVTAGAAWTGFEMLGHQAQMAAGLGVGAGVAAAALTGRWIERRHVDRERRAKLQNND